MEKKVVGTDTIHFIPRNKVLIDAKVMYANSICYIRPLKEEGNRVHLTIEGDNLYY